MAEFKDWRQIIKEEEALSLAEKEDGFKDAMRKRQYDSALDLITPILSKDRETIREEDTGINQEHLDMARKLALKYFEHNTSLLKNRYKKRYKLPDDFDIIEKGRYSPRSLKAIWNLYKLLKFEINLVPEAQEKDSELHKVLKLEYKNRVSIEDYNSAYELGKIGGFLDKDEYKKIFDIAVDKNNVGTAHDYATEGKLYDTSEPQIRSWLDELESIRRERIEIRGKKEKENLDLREFVEKYRDDLKLLDKRRKDTEELLVASVE